MGPTRFFSEWLLYNYFQDLNVVTVDADGSSEECIDVCQVPAEASDEYQKQSTPGGSPKKHLSRQVSAKYLVSDLSTD